VKGIETNLIASNVDERHTRTVGTTFADLFEVAIEELGARNFETLLDNLGSELVGAVLCGIAKDVFNGTSLVRSGTMLADMLNAPVAELAVRNDIDTAEDFVDAGTLEVVVSNEKASRNEALTLSSSKQFSKMFCTTRLPVSPRATSCHMPRKASLTYFMI